MTAKPEQATEKVLVDEGKVQEFKLNRNGLVELTSKLGDTAVVAESVPVWLERGFSVKK